MIGRAILVGALVVLVIASVRTEPLQVSVAQQVTNTPTRTPTRTATSSPSPTATTTPTITSTPTASATPTSSATATQTPGTTGTPTATATTTASTTTTPTLRVLPATATSTRTPTQTVSTTPTQTRTPTSTQTVKPTQSPTASLTPTVVVPVLSNVDTSSQTRSSVTVTWTSDVPATSQVGYGTSSADALHSPPDPSLVTAHHVVLSGLQPGTSYRFRVRSVSAGGASALSPENVLVTAPPGSGPEFSSPVVRQITGSTATLSWSTSTGTVAQVEYGSSANYGLFTLLKAFASPAQQLTLDGLLPNTTYHFRIKGWDSSGSLSATPDATFTTAPAGPATLIGGDHAIQSERVTLAAGQSAAYQFVASASGQASLLRLFVDAGTTTPVIRVALYSDADGLPGVILSQGSAPGLTAGWVNFALPPVSILESTRYWIAVLSPLGGGSVVLREAALGGSSMTSAQTTLAAFPQTWAPGAVGARSPLSAAVLQVPPAVTLTSPAEGSILTGRAQLSAVVDDDAPLARVQFYVDGLPAGAPITGVAPYTVTWDSSGLNPNVPHTISAQATDALGRASGSRLVSVQVDNGPAIFSVIMAPGLTARGVRVSWLTDVLADGQVEFGPTLAYGSVTPLDGRPDWRHDMQLTGLLPATLYHYRVRSRDANGVVSVSSDYVFFTP